MSSETKNDSSSTKYPKWDGTKENWPRFRTEMEGAISGQTRFGSYATALRDKNYVVLKPDQVSVAATNELQKLEEKLRRNDTELFRILCSCIKQEGEEKFVYQLILKTKKDGYTDGSFKAAWELLIKVYERNSKEELKSLQKKYINLEMKEDEDPYQFFMKMADLRTLMENNHNHTIPEETYLQEIID